MNTDPQEKENEHIIDLDQPKVCWHDDRKKLAVACYKRQVR